MKPTTKSFIFLSILFIFALSSCENRPSHILSRGEMVDFLVDFHKLEGSLTLLNSEYPLKTEENEYYLALLEKHDITQAEFDSSLVWYTQHPKNFEKVYLQVEAELTKYQQDIENGQYNTEDSIVYRTWNENIWPLNKQLRLNNNTERTNFSFKIENPKLLWNDIYTLSFNQRIHPEDSCENQHIVLRIEYENGKVDSAYSKAYQDNKYRQYVLRIKAKRKEKIKQLTGELLGYTKKKGKCNSITENIKLVRTFDALAQDSIREIIYHENIAEDEKIR